MSGRRIRVWPFLLIMVAVSACAQSGREDGNAIILGMTNSAINLDPRVGTDEASQKVHQLIFSPLFRVDNELRVVPAVGAPHQDCSGRPCSELAESYEQPDPITYVVRLRHGVLFHNGRELTSDDVVYTFRSFLDPKFRGRTAAYRMLAAVTPLDRYTVEFKLKTPVGSFPINLVMGIVQAGSGAANTRQPIGTGPYRLAQFVSDDRVVLTPFDQYYGGRPRNDGLMLKVIPDDTMRGLELRKGSVDLIVNDLAPDVVSQLQQEGRVQVETAPGTDYAYLGLNLRDPILSRLEVRKAIGYAIDRDAIVKYLRRDYATKAFGIVPPMSWAAERNVFDFTHDPGEAERLLDAAGYRDPDGPGPLPRFRLSLKTSTSEVYRLQAAAIQHDLAQVGIAIEIRSSEFQTLSADVVRGNFQMYSLQFVGVTDPDMLRLVYHSQMQPPAGLNRVHYVNADVDRFIDQAGAATDDAQRHLFYTQAQQQIARDVPYVSLWYKKNVAIFQPDIHGVKLSPTADFTFLKDVYRDPHGSVTHP